MEENNQRQKEIMDKIYQNDIIIIKERETKIQREESIKKQRKLDSLREGLKKQIEEKNKNKNDSRNKELDYFKNTILKSVQDYSKAQEIIEQEKIIAIVDASHPYAIAISETVIKIAQSLQIPYLRYERAALSLNKNITEDSLSITNKFVNLKILKFIKQKIIDKKIFK
jgi:hypothetical protein